MAEPNSNAKLAERLIGIGTALRDAGKPAAKTNADVVDYRLARDRVKRENEVAAAQAFLEQSEGGRQVVNLLGLLLEDVGALVCSNTETLAAFERRLAQLEARPGLKYQGVWDPQQSYVAGDFVTRAGSVWHCNCACSGEQPGDGACWTLAVQHGRDLRK